MKGRTLIAVIFAVVGFVSLLSGIVILEERREGEIQQIHQEISTILEIKNSGDVSYLVESVRESVKSFNLSMGQLGLTDEVVQEILSQGYIATAHKQMKFAIENKTTKDVSIEVEWAKELADKAGYALDEIGYPSDVVTEVLRQGYISQAQNLIRYARDNQSNKDVSIEVEWAKELAEKAGVGLSDL